MTLLAHIDLTVIWAVIIGFAIVAYVVLDGFDLGIGILFPLIAAGNDRDTAMNSVAPVWDGNETWLVLGGGGARGAEAVQRRRGPFHCVAGVLPHAGDDGGAVHA